LQPFTTGVEIRRQTESPQSWLKLIGSRLAQLYKSATVVCKWSAAAR
jgi:hypothetical protein